MKYYIKELDNVTKVIADDENGNILKIKVFFDADMNSISAEYCWIAKLPENFVECVRDEFTFYRNKYEHINEVSLIGNRPTDR